MPIERKVKEPFYYAVDGRNAKLLRAGRSYPFKPEDAARFETEGYLDPEAGEQAARPKRVRKAK